MLNIFRYIHSDYWRYVGDTNLIYYTGFKSNHRWYLITERARWYTNSGGKPSIMLDPNLFDYHLNYISNSVDEILERLPEEVQNEIIFNLHRFTGSKSAQHIQTYYVGDTNLIYNSSQNVLHNWYLVTEWEVPDGEWYANAKGKPSIMLEQNLFDYHGLNYILNPVDEILERLPEEAQTEFIFNLHRFAGNKSA